MIVVGDADGLSTEDAAAGRAAGGTPDFLAVTGGVLITLGVIALALDA